MSTEYYQKKGYKKQKVCQCGERFLGSGTAKYCYDCKIIRKQEINRNYLQRLRDEKLQEKT